ncbi:hypothetical protein G6F32_014795 [Rhizopus arrhizus]|nr:hypothetical protein G6F32_014795 [Rhizopus arrhizus]
MPAESASGPTRWRQAGSSGVVPQWSSLGKRDEERPGPLGRPFGKGVVRVGSAARQRQQPFGNPLERDLFFGGAQLERGAGHAPDHAAGLVLHQRRCAGLAHFQQAACTIVAHAARPPLACAGSPPGRRRPGNASAHRHG